MQRGDDATERLDASVSMAQRTDDIGDDILESLQEQRRRSSARCSAESMEGDMDISERKMTQMACEVHPAWVLWVIAALVTGLFFLYWKIEIEPEKKRTAPRRVGGVRELSRKSARPTRRRRQTRGVGDRAFARG